MEAKLRPSQTTLCPAVQPQPWLLSHAGALWDLKDFPRTILPLLRSSSSPSSAVDLNTTSSEKFSLPAHQRKPQTARVVSASILYRPFTRSEHPGVISYAFNVSFSYSAVSSRKAAKRLVHPLLYPHNLVQCLAYVR